jgi:hypothetical protein
MGSSFQNQFIPTKLSILKKGQKRGILAENQHLKWFRGICFSELFFVYSIDRLPPLLYDQRKRP